jgi:hypothetical protein
MKEAPGSSETSVLTRATRRNNPEDTILQLKDAFPELDRFLSRDTLLTSKTNSVALSPRAKYTD